MLVLELDCPAGQRERLIAELWELGTAGVLEGEGVLSAYFEASADRRALEAALAAYAPRIREEPERDWTALARSQWKSAPVGRRFFLAPEWCDEPTPPGRLRLRLRPRQACGTGLHAATRLCLELMEEWVRPGATLLDVGTGSGLLAEAAVLLGAGRVLACDIQAEAVAEARERFREERIEVALFQGSLRGLRPAVADLAVVNISAEAAIQLAGELARVLKHGGEAIVSGFRRRAVGRVAQAMEAARFRIREHGEREGWSALVCYTPSYAQA